MRSCNLSGTVGRTVIHTRYVVVLIDVGDGSARGAEVAHEMLGADSTRPAWWSRAREPLTVVAAGN